MGFAAKLIQFDVVAVLLAHLSSVSERRLVFQTCYLCEKKGETVKSTSGACMECNKNGCTRNFHVTWWVLHCTYLRIDPPAYWS